MVLLGLAKRQWVGSAKTDYLQPPSPFPKFLPLSVGAHTKFAGADKEMCA